jgi:Fe2+ or Zn2+ uptake regulation protein
MYHTPSGKPESWQSSSPGRGVLFLCIDQRCGSSKAALSTEHMTEVGHTCSSDCRIEELAERIVEETRFAMESHAVILFGVCRNCQRE